MRAVRQHEYGRPLVVEEVPDPVAGPGEVVVRVLRAAVNPLDVWVAAGSMAATASPLPRVPGGEGCGVLPDGTRVAFRGGGLGILRDGSYAEQVAIPEEIAVPVPDGVPDAQAAGLGIVGTTALDCLDLARVEAGTTVLVLGASGGVGAVACQLARGRGARVIAQTGSEARAATVAALADDVVVADAETLEAAVREVSPDGVDVVLDPLAGPFSPPAVRLLRRFGRAVLFGASAGSEYRFSPQEMYRKGAQVIGYSGLYQPVAVQTAGLARLLAEVAAGRLAVAVTAELPLEQAEEAHRRIRAREAGGKLLLVP